MNSIVITPSRWRYLGVIGAFNRWIFAAFVLFAAFILYVRITGGRPNTAPYLFFFLLPLAAGTGLLTSGRRGELDLILGAGETRSRLWQAALVQAVVLPAVLAVTILVLAGPPDPRVSLGVTVARLIGVLLFTGGVSFAAGLVELRYLAGVVWLLLRLVFIMTPAGLATLTMLSKGVEVPSAGAMFVTAMLAPETLLEPRMPAVYTVVAALLGSVALAASYQWFKRADFGGKRS